MKKIKLLSVLILITLLLVSLAGCGGTYANWELSSDGTVLTETVKYNESYELVGSLFGMEIAGEIISFQNDVITEDGVYYYVYAPSEDPDVVYLTRYSAVFVYVRDEVPPALMEYLAGIPSSSKIVDRSAYGRDITEEERIALDDLAPTDVFDVRELMNVPLYELRVYDSTGTIVHTHGGFYVVEESVYYVNYDALDNSHFDANGYFSYRSGSVEMVKLEGDYAELVLDTSSFERYDEVSYTFEEPIDNESDKEENEALARGALVLFLVLAFMIPSIVPLVLMVIDIFRRGFKGVSATTYVILGAVVVLNAALLSIILIAF